MSKVILENVCPDRSPVKLSASLVDLVCGGDGKKEGTFDFNFPKVRKLRLTEESEQSIFGDVDPYRDSPFPPLPFGRDRFYETELAEIDEENAAVYNARQQKLHESNLRWYADSMKRYKEATYVCCSPILREPKEPKPKFIKVGTVVVSRSGWDLKLTNIEEKND